MNVEYQSNTIIKNVNMATQYYLDMQRYALYVLSSRALADYKDGQKPIQRRIMFAMAYLLSAITPRTVKSAKIAGTVVGSLNPHGDTACYGAMGPLVNWFQTKIPFLIKQGSFGTFQGDEAAAMRYTEAGLNQFAIENVIGELSENPKVVDWSETYTRTDYEPNFLPVKFPVLLVNGTFGIAIGSRPYVPRHNLVEVIDATLDLIDHPDHQVVLIPDCSMACEIINADWKSICNKGRGSFKTRAVIDIEQYKGHDALIVKSLPDQVTLKPIEDAIEDLIAKKKLVQIYDAFDESHNDTLRYVILLKHGADPNYVKEVLYKSTDLTSSFCVNFEALDDIVPTRFSYTSYIKMWIMFRIHTKNRLYNHRISKVNTDLHKKLTYLQLMESGQMDKAIEMIKKFKSSDKKALTELFIKEFKITDIQAQFVLDAKLHQLSMANYQMYKDQSQHEQKLIQEYKKYLIDESLIINEIKQELIDIKTKYGTPRICRVINEASVDIPAGVFKIVVTEDNKIKKLEVNDPIMNRNTATPISVITADNRENILLVDEKGKVFKLPVSKILFTDRNAGGCDIRLLVKKLTSNIKTMIYEPDLKARAELVNKSYVVAVTAHGYIKKLDVDDFISAPPSGVTFMRLEVGDVIKAITVTDNSNDVIVYSNTHALRLNLDSIPYQQKNSKGLMAMQTKNVIDGIELIPKESNSEIVVLTVNGRVNRFNQLALPVSSRAKSGSKVIKLGETDRIFGIYSVNANDILHVLTAASGTKDIPVSSIAIGTSVSSGTKLLSTRSDAIIDANITRN